MIETSPALEKTFYQYSHLPLGGKEISCPYWMNSLEKKTFGPFAGKGKPAQIVLAVEEEAKKAGLDLSKLSDEEILSFIKEKSIGVDCSGFAFQMLNSLDIERGGNGISDDIPHCRGKIFCRANAMMLTKDDVSFPVENLNEIRVGDMLRLIAGKHIAIVLRVLRENNLVKEIEYAHSSGLSEINGVHESKIIVDKENSVLENQTWLEKTAKGENYKTTYFPEKGDGIKRLKIWA